MDHLARGSMKNAANCASECELQDTWASTLWTHIAELAFCQLNVWLRVGLTSIRTCFRRWGVCSGFRTASMPLNCGSGWAGCLSNSWDFVPGLRLRGWRFRLLDVSGLPSRGLGLDLVSFVFRPESRQGYPPNLSILISGGKENNCDALSNGEWNGRSPSPNLRPSRSCGMWCLEVSSCEFPVCPSPPWQGP